MFALGSGHYDLRRRAEIDRMLAETSPDAVVHLAALVGGIGANRPTPAGSSTRTRSWASSCSRPAGSPRSPRSWSGYCVRLPEARARAVPRGSLWDGYPEETNAPYGLAKKMLLVQAQAYRAEYGMNVVYLLPVNLYGPRDNFDLESSHVIPAMIRKFVEARDRGEDGDVVGGREPTREFLYVRDAARASGSPLSATTGPSRSTSVPGRRSPSATSPR